MWLLGPDYVQAQEEYRYLWEWLTYFDLIQKYTMPTDGQRTIITKTGWTIITKSAKYPERLGSVAPNVIVMCEPGQISGDVYIMARGRLMQKRGYLFMCGTLEAGEGNHPNWQWFEDMAAVWQRNEEGDQHRAFSLPTWTNRKLYPLGEQDPELVQMKLDLPEYTYNRKIAARPSGVNNPCLPDLWRENATDYYFKEPPAKFVAGAIGVDYGTSDTHPSSVAVVQQDEMGRFWVRETWTEKGGNHHAIVAKVAAMKKRYDLGRGRTDPHQDVLAALLNFNVADRGPWSTEVRIGIASGLVEDDYLFFDMKGTETMDAFSSLRRMRRMKDSRGRLVYNREIGDDQAQAVLYALEELRGARAYLPDLNNTGGMKMSYAQIPSRAGMVGRA